MGDPNFERQILPKTKGLTPEEKEEVRVGMEIFFKYADRYIGFFKIRSWQTELTDEEKEIRPVVQRAMKLLGMKIND